MKARVREVALEALSLAGVVALAGSLVWIGAASQSDRIGELETQLSQVEGERDEMELTLEGQYDVNTAFSRMLDDDETTAVMLYLLGDEPQEDDPGWDCRIHGDQMCGPQD